MKDTILCEFLSALGVLIVWFILVHYKNIYYFVSSFLGVPENYLIIRGKYRWVLNHQQRRFIHGLLLRSPNTRTPIQYNATDSWEIKQLKFLEDEGLISTLEDGNGSDYERLNFSLQIVLKESFWDTFQLRSQIRVINQMQQTKIEQLKESCIDLLQTIIYMSHVCLCIGFFVGISIGVLYICYHIL